MELVQGHKLIISGGARRLCDLKDLVFPSDVLAGDITCGEVTPSLSRCLWDVAGGGGAVNLIISSFPAGV